MSDGAMLIDTAERLFADLLDDEAMRRARAGEWLADVWAAVEEMGLPLALVPEDSGGFGIAGADALALIRLAGRHALPLPLPETMIANLAFAQAGLPLAEGPAAFLPAEGGRVPWGRHVTTLAAERPNGAIARVTGMSVEAEALDLAGMPRDTLGWDDEAAQQGARSGVPLQILGGAMRSLQIAGALERVLALTIGHVSERRQFGRELVKFQAIQHELARLAEETAAAGAAADMAAEAILSGGEATLPVAAARIRSGEAVGTATGIAHQLHGAIGFTQEHRLHWYTTSLWSWRDDYGGQHHWSQLLGGAAIEAGGAGFWNFVTEAA